MPSISLQQWVTSQRSHLDEVVAVHGAVRRRFHPGAVEQANHFYAVLLSANFQSYCRDLHSECVQRIVQEIPALLQNVVCGEFLHDRRLDRGNPNSDNIRVDFGRLGLQIWEKVKALDGRNARRQQQLDEMVKW